MATRGAPSARFRIQGSVESARRFLGRHAIEPQSIRVRGHHVSFAALLTEEEASFAHRAGLAVDFVQDIQAGRDRRSDAGLGNRFAGGGLPRKAGVEPPPEYPQKYFNEAESQQALVNLRDAFPTLTTLFPLRYPTSEGRVVQGLHVRKIDGVDRPAFIFIGCIHGNEWGSCEILLHYVSGLLDAYTNQTGLSYGNGAVQFDSQAVKSLLDNNDFVVVPIVNADGRALSQAGITNADLKLGRKNANGVDLNRNFDLMFNFDYYVTQGASLSVGQSPSDFVFQGPAPLSEVETRNVCELFNRFPRCRWFVDLHSFGNEIYYGWCCDEVQSADPNMTFTNPAYAGQWGKEGDGVGEYLDPRDMGPLKTMAERFVTEATKVRQTDFQPVPGFTFTVMPGTSVGHAMARHKIDPQTGSVLAFCIEWGVNDPQPPPDVMAEVVEEVSAGLTGLCLAS